MNKSLLLIFVGLNTSKSSSFEANSFSSELQRICSHEKSTLRTNWLLILSLLPSYWNTYVTWTISLIQILGSREMDQHSSFRSRKQWTGDRLVNKNIWYNDSELQCQYTVVRIEISVARYQCYRYLDTLSDMQSVFPASCIYKYFNLHLVLCRWNISKNIKTKKVTLHCLSCNEFIYVSKTFSAGNVLSFK